MGNSMYSVLPNPRPELGELSRHDCGSVRVRPCPAVPSMLCIAMETGKVGTGLPANTRQLVAASNMRPKM